MRAVLCRNVKVHLDSYHMNIEENSMHEAVATCGESLGCAPLTACILTSHRNAD